MGERLLGKVAIVTGAGSVGPGWGIGKATAVLFAREGARVLLNDRNRAAAEETRAIVEEEGGRCLVHAADVSRSDQVKGMVDACLDAWGRIDVLYNNVAIGVPGGPVETDEKSWDLVMAVNVKAMFLTCKHVLPVMERQGAGAIVNVSSLASRRAGKVALLSYGTSKAAVNQFTRLVAAQYAPKNIRANVILPGMMNTPTIVKGLSKAYGGSVDEMIRVRDAACPMGHMGDAWDIAHAALFLASDEARYISGSELVVDGAQSAVAG